jgi:hypothetical protein
MGRLRPGDPTPVIFQRSADARATTFDVQETVPAGCKVRYDVRVTGSDRQLSGTPSTRSSSHHLALSMSDRPSRDRALSHVSRREFARWVSLASAGVALPWSASASEPDHQAPEQLRQERSPMRSLGPAR